MHLAIEATGIKHSGGATVLHDFLLAALNDARVDRITIFCSPRAVRNFTMPCSPKLIESEHPLAEYMYLYRILWLEWLLPKQCRRIGADVLVCMAGMGRAWPRTQQITFVQQSLPFSKEALQLLRAKEKARILIIRQLMRRSCRAAKKVIIQTPTMKEWISTAFALPEQRSEVIIPSVETTGVAESDVPLLQMTKVPTGMRLLYVGNNSLYKNVGTVIAGMKKLREHLPQATLFLTWPKEHEVNERPEVVCLGQLSKPELFQAYRSSTVLVMPSLVETVGLPMLEAMSVGIPVLAADRPYAHDICESAAEFFDPLCPDQFASTVRSLLGSRDSLKALSEKGKALSERRRQERPYSKMVESVLMDYDKLDRPPSPS